MMKPNIIAHLSSAHPRHDVRIFVKECKTLSSSGYMTHLVVADGLVDETVDNISIHSSKKQSGRLKRVLLSSFQVGRLGYSLKADLYHLHDPELLPVGIILKLLGKKVVFDAHEDVLKQVKGKEYLNKIQVMLITALYGAFERFAASFFDGIITATPSIKEKYLKINKNTVDIKNYPKLTDLALNFTKEKKNQICYAGGLSEIRGIEQLVMAMDDIEISTELVLAGNFDLESFKLRLESLPGWKKVRFIGWQDRQGIGNLMSSSLLGLVILRPAENYLDSLPVKMFEYMLAGIPVIASNFPLWESIVNQHKCGICVDPTSSAEISSAIKYLLNNPKIAKDMGENGRKAILEKLNWSGEEETLIRFYRNILK